MSQWTHVAGLVRLDGIGVMKGWTPEDEKRELEKVLTASSLPFGSEGPLQYQVQIIFPQNQLCRGHIVLWGDLRDYDDVKEIRKWFEGLLSNFSFDYYLPNQLPFFVRAAVMSIDVEFSGRRILLTWNEKKLVAKVVRVKNK